MANKNLNELPSIDPADLGDADFLMVWDSATSTTNKVLASELATYIAPIEQGGAARTWAADHQNADFTVAAWDTIVEVDTGFAGVTITIPAAVNTGDTLLFQKIAGTASYTLLCPDGDHVVNGVGGAGTAPSITGDDQVILRVANTDRIVSRGQLGISAVAPVVAGSASVTFTDIGGYYTATFTGGDGAYDELGIHKIEVNFGTIDIFFNSTSERDDFTERATTFIIDGVDVLINSGQTTGTFGTPYWRPFGVSSAIAANGTHTVSWS